jgi:hypothetical protein
VNVSKPGRRYTYRGRERERERAMEGKIWAGSVKATETIQLGQAEQFDSIVSSPCYGLYSSFVF